MTLVPTFRVAHPSEALQRRLKPAQRAFYRRFEDGLATKSTIEVEGNDGYLFRFVLEQMREISGAGHEAASYWPKMAKSLRVLGAAYSLEIPFAWYAKMWSLECLLAGGDYARFLELTEPENPFEPAPSDEPDPRQWTLERLNAAMLAGLEPDALDICALALASSRASSRPFGVELKDEVRARFVDAAEQEGPWLPRLIGAPYENFFFGGSGLIDAKAVFRSMTVKATEAARIHELMETAENQVRSRHGREAIGLEHGLARLSQFGAVADSESAAHPTGEFLTEERLVLAVAEAFPDTRCIRHGRPPWLGRQHLDIWLPDLRAAVEFQGGQHFEPLAAFGGESQFHRQISRDTRKARLCQEQGIQLILATSANRASDVVDLIRRHGMGQRQGDKAV